MEPEVGVTVVFHVLLVSNFKMEEVSLHIRASGADLGNFGINCVDMALVRLVCLNLYYIWVTSSDKLLIPKKYEHKDNSSLAQAIDVSANLFNPRHT